MSVDFGLADLLRPTVSGLGYELLGIEQQRSSGRVVIRLYIDSDNGITVDDCARVSQQVDGVLEAETLVSGAYTLEVSSPGLDRPLFTLDQHKPFIGAEVHVRLRSLVEGRRKLSGKLVGVLAEAISVQEDDHTYEIPFHLVERSRLVPVWPERVRRAGGSRESRVRKL